MQQPKNDLQRDALVVLRHLPFIIGVLLVALLVALATGVIAGQSYKASAVVQVQANTLSLPGSIKPQAAIDLARSSAVTEEAARNLGIDDLGSLSARVSVNDRPEGLRVNATGESEEAAAELANAWAAAIETVINSTSLGAAATAALKGEVASAEKQLQDAEQAVAAASRSGVEPSQNVLDEVARTLARNQAELANLTNAADVVRQAIADGNASMAQLRAALSNLAVPTEGLIGLQTPQDLLQALDLRRQVISTSIQQTIEQLNTLQQQRRQVLPLLLERDAAQNNYREAVRILRAAELGLLTAKVSEQAVGADTAGVDLLQRLGVAAAFGLVVGIVGAFGLETLPSMRRWLRQNQENSSS